MDQYCASLQKVYRYVGFHHYADDASAEFLEEWLKERFEVFFGGQRERGEHSGLHIQWYGETRIEWSKSDTNKHGKTGLLTRYLASDGISKKAKRWSKQEAKGTREVCMEYCTKPGGWERFCSNGDPALYADKWKVRGEKKRTFHETLLEIHAQAGYPSGLEEVGSLLARSRVLPWNKVGTMALVDATLWVLSQSDNDRYHDLVMQNFTASVDRRLSRNL